MSLLYLYQLNEGEKMKKKKLLIGVILAIFLLIPVINVNAADCSSITKKSTCNKRSSCTWKNKSCQEKSNSSNTATNEKVNSTNVKFCTRTAKIWKIVGRIFMVVKIVIPIILIIYSTIDLSKAVVVGKDDELKKVMKAFMIRAISGVVIFFIPTIITLFMGLIVGFSKSGAEEDYKVCRTCIMNPSRCNTSKDASN